MRTPQETSSPIDSLLAVGGSRTAAVRRITFSAAILLLPGSLSAQVVDENFYSTDGAVYATQLSGNTLYIGGAFQKMGRPLGNWVPVDAATGAPLATFPKVAGVVHAAIPDGAGGWFIGGSFTGVGGIPKTNVARILADNTVADGYGNANDVVYALARSGTTLFIGGSFTQVSSQPRQGLAALDGNGQVTSFNVGISGTSVRALATSDTVLYVGGLFSGLGGFARACIGGIRLATGHVTSWNPTANNTVHTLLVDGTTIYAGGEFSGIGGRVRSRIAALSSVTGVAAATWDPNANNNVFALALDGPTLYVGGNFTQIGSQPRSWIAALNVSDGLATGWNPNALAENILTPAVRALAVSSGTVYVGGHFTIIGGQYRNFLAAVSAATGQATAWNPDPNAAVRAVGVAGGAVYAGGDFFTFTPITRNFIAAIDVTTGVPTSFNPNANANVWALEVNGSTVYAGGDFSSIGGQTRGSVAALNATTGLATGSDPQLGGRVLALALAGPRLYVGGISRLVALDPTTTLNVGWNSEVNGNVFALAASGSSVYVGGTFTFVSGNFRSRIAELVAATGEATSWDPNANEAVQTLASTGSVVYVGGYFNNIGSANRSIIAALDAGSGLATSWYPAGVPLGLPNALEPIGSSVYVGANVLKELDATTGAATPWDPKIGGALALSADAGTVYAGGYFTSVEDLPVRGIAAIGRPVVSVPNPDVHASHGLQGWPNPSSVRYTIRFSLPSPDRVSLKVYDVRGREVRTLIVNDQRGVGGHQVTFDTRGLENGIYFYRLQTGRFEDVKKMIVLH